MVWDGRVHEEKAERPTTALLRKNIMACLHRHYPHMSKWPGESAGFIERSPWLIDIKDFKTGGVITIRNLLLSGSSGVTIKLKSLNTDPDLKIIMRNAGLLLERYKITREKALDIREDIYGMPRDFRGLAIAVT